MNNIKSMLASVKKIVESRILDIQNDFEDMVFRTWFLGKKVKDFEKMGKALDNISIDRASNSYKKLRKEYKIPDRKLNAVKYAQMHGSEFITKMGDELRAKVNNVIIRGIQNDMYPENIASELRELFNRYIHTNWRRIAVTEVANNFTQGYLMAIPEGYRVLGSSAVDACPICMKQIHNKVYTVVDPKKKNKNSSTEIWIGKNVENYGEASSDWTPAIPQHPHCRCRWIMLYPFQDFDKTTGKIVMKPVTKSVFNKQERIFAKSINKIYNNFILKGEE